MAEALGPLFDEEHFGDFWSEIEDDFVPEAKIHFGPERDQLASVLRSQINIAGQMRQEKSNDHIVELSQSIRSTELQNPIIVYELSPEVAEWYVELTNDIWGEKRKFADFIPNDRGNYFILSAGEMRLSAMDLILEEEGIEPEEATIACLLKYHDTPHSMMKVQIAENIHQRPKPYQYAAILQNIYLLGLEEEIYEGPEDFIKDSPASPETTRNALAFFELPLIVREYVAESKLPYWHSLELAPYVEFLNEMLDQEGLSGAARESRLSKLLRGKMALMLSLRRSLKSLPSTIGQWIDEERYYAESFDEFAQQQTDDEVELSKSGKIHLKNVREIHNAATRALKSTTEAMTDLRQMLGPSTQFRITLGLSPTEVSADAARNLLPELRKNMLRELEALRPMLEIVAEELTGDSLEELLRRRIEEVDVILESADPDWSLGEYKEA